MPYWRTKTEKIQALHEQLQAERWPFITQDSNPATELQRMIVRPRFGGAMPNAAQMLEWFLWGVFMGGGWFVINWLLAKVLH